MNCRLDKEAADTLTPGSRAAVGRQLRLLPARGPDRAPSGPHQLHLRPPDGLLHRGAHLRYEQLVRRHLSALHGWWPRRGQPAGLPFTGRTLHAANGGLRTEGGLCSGKALKNIEIDGR